LVLKKINKKDLKILEKLFFEISIWQNLKQQ